jgi:hypothetical protein
MNNVFKLIEDNGLTLHGDIEHFAELVRADERKQVALDKKAENARELGLDYEPDYKVTVVDDQHPNGIPLEQWGRPAQRPWVGLTDDEIDDLYQGAGKNDLKRAREIEAKLEEKNT